MNRRPYWKTFAVMRKVRQARISVFAAGLAAVALLSGCAGMPPDLTDSGKMELERIDSPTAHVGPVHVWAADSGLMVSGSLSDPNGRRGRIPGHLHIEAIGDNGVPLAAITTDYYRLSFKARQEKFSKELPVDPGDVRKIRVIHHESSHKHC